MKQEKREFITYLMIAFVLAWTLQVIGVVSKHPVCYQIFLAACMYAPFIAVWIAKRGLKEEKSGIKWKLQLKRNWKWILLAWFTPAMLTLLGAFIYFLCVRGEFDSGMGYVRKTFGAFIGEDGTIQGVPFDLFPIINIAAALTYAPVLNCFFALGEEAGWRGYMTPKLTEWIGEKKALVLSGIIWALWHAPVIVLAGYEYGTGYFGAPVTGILMMGVFTTAMGILCSMFYKKTDCIWVPSILHGAANAVAALPLLFTDGSSTSYILGPTMAGGIAGIPLFVIAVVLLIRKS